MSGRRNVWVSFRLICQYIIRVSCYENYTRNTQTALVSTLLPVSYTLRCARWTSVCTKLCRRGQDVEHHRRARCDGSSAPCSRGPRISPHGCEAGAVSPLMWRRQTRTFSQPSVHRVPTSRCSLAVRTPAGTQISRPQAPAGLKLNRPQAVALSLRCCGSVR